MDVMVVSTVKMTKFIKLSKKSLGRTVNLSGLFTTELFCALEILATSSHIKTRLIPG